LPLFFPGVVAPEELVDPPTTTFFVGVLDMVDQSLYTIGVKFKFMFEEVPIFQSLHVVVFKITS
jgi:hypothetical protein